MTAAIALRYEAWLIGQVLDAIRRSDARAHPDPLALAAAIEALACPRCGFRGPM